jgi:hypothetical protein
MPSCYDTTLTDPKIYDANYDVFTCVLNSYSDSVAINLNPAICSNAVSNASHDNLKVQMMTIGYE